MQPLIIKSIYQKIKRLIMVLFRALALSMYINYLALRIKVKPVYYLTLYLYLSLFLVIKQVSVGAQGSPIFLVLFGDAQQGIHWCLAPYCKQPSPILPIDIFYKLMLVFLYDWDISDTIMLKYGVKVRCIRWNKTSAI